MNPEQALSSETSLDTPNCRTRSTGTVSRTSSNRSSLSHESKDSLDQSRRSSVPQSPKPSHKKSGSFSRLFGVKEPSLDSFKQLAEQQQKELAQKGQKLPFGVSQAKLPSTVRDDYKRAKQRAKERAKLHEAVKEKLKLHEDEERQRHNRRLSASSISTDEDYQPTGSIAQLPKSPKSGRKKSSSLDPLPEGPNIDAVVESPRTSAFLPSSPTSCDHKRASARVAGCLTGNARKETLP